jgi:VWFA-related protein
LTGTTSAVLVAVGGLLWLEVAGPWTAVAQDQRPTFVGGVEVVAVEVQVVDGDGRPIAGLTPAQFDVTIGGKKRRVLSADFVTAGASGSPATATTPPSTGGTTAMATGPVRAAGRKWVLAFDCASFDGAGMHRAMQSATRFIAGLPASDQIAVFTYPTGPALDSTTDRTAIAAALARVSGQKDATSQRFNIRPSEVIDWMVPDATVKAYVARRECGGDAGCAQALDLEVQTRAAFAERALQQHADTLRSLVRQVASAPGRKTLVLVSAGILASDRPGARLQMTDDPNRIGKDAASGNVMVYALFIDQGFLKAGAAESRKLDRRVDSERDNVVMGRWMDVFSGAAGGAWLHDVIGDGETLFDHVTLETSAVYLLGVEPQDADRDGKLRELKVKVPGRKASVRGRTWITVPAK